MDTKERILRKVVTLFAREGESSLNIRLLAKKVGIAPSVIYHYFESKDTLLKEMFDQTNTHLGVVRAALPRQHTVRDMMRQRIHFQLEHADEIVAVLRYYLAFRDQFKSIDGGYVPKKAYLHIEEVLRFGITNGELDPSMDVDEDAKVITHAVNGFVLEFYPMVPGGTQREMLVDRICTFLLRGLLWLKM